MNSNVHILLQISLDFVVKANIHIPIQPLYANGRKCSALQSIMYYDKNGAGRDNEEGLAFEYGDNS